MAHGKRYRALAEQIDAAKSYPLSEAVALVKKTSTVKFDASVELHVRLGIDPKKAEQAVRGIVKLPFGTGKQVKIAVFATGKAADDAKEAGADLVGSDDLIKGIKDTGVTDFDIAVATPDLMKQLAPIAKTLGQRGLMPNPKNETVNPNPGLVVRDLRGGKVAFRSDATGNLHQTVGKVSFEDVQIVENVREMLEAVKRSKPNDVKGTYLAGITLASTMGPAVKVDPRL